MLSRLITLLTTLLLSLTAAADEPTLFIQNGQTNKIYTRTELLSRPEITTIETTDDPVYHGQAVTYVAIPAEILFEGMTIPNDATIQFEALDGFSAPVSKELLLNKDQTKSVAYIAIEPKDKKWRAIKPGINDSTPGPFYLIWKNVKKSNISSEQWVFQLAGFKIEEPFETLFPHIKPKNLDSNTSVMQGFKVFQTNCMTCHTMNKEGKGKVGPDLNVPRNVTEYLTEQHIKTFVRNPQNIRYFPQEKMSAFSSSIISDQELNALIDYLKYMKDHKVN